MEFSYPNDMEKWADEAARRIIEFRIWWFGLLPKQKESIVQAMNKQQKAAKAEEAKDESITQTR